MNGNKENKRKPYGIDTRDIKDICRQIFENYDVKVVQVRETNIGYKFYGKYDILLGEWNFDFEQGHYKSFNFYIDAPAAIKNKQKEESRTLSSEEILQIRKDLSKRFGLDLDEVLLSSNHIKGYIFCADMGSPKLGILADVVYDENSNSFVKKIYKYDLLGVPVEKMPKSNTDEKTPELYGKDYKDVINTIKTIKKLYDLEIVKLIKNDKGFEFIAKDNFPFGSMDFDFEKGCYKTFSIYPAAFEMIRNKERESLNNAQNPTGVQKPTGKKKLQKNTKRGVAFAATSMAILIGLGVIKGNIDKNNSQHDYSIAETTNTGIELKEANDLIALSWANYAMEEIRESCSSSPYEMVQNMSPEIRTEYFAPLMSSYYDYLDQSDSFLPEDMVAQSKAKQREKLKSKISSFNKRLDDPYFKDLVFENTKYAQAIIVDNNGLVVTQDGKYKGEVVDSEGTTLTYDESSKWRIYIPILSIPGNRYELGNLPEDAILHNGNIYIGIEHYDDFTKENEVKGKY